MTTTELRRPTFSSLSVEVRSSLIPERMIVDKSEILSPNLISCGVASESSDLLGRRLVATSRYIERGYISQDHLSGDGTYFDEYEPHSIPLVAKMNGTVIASMRLISNISPDALPISKRSEIGIFDDWVEKTSTVSFELSQLAKSANYSKDPRPTLGIIRTYMQLARELNKTTAVAVIDEGVRQQLNGPFLGFDLPIIGPTVHYMGSDSTPVWINISDVTQNSRKNNHPDVADFLEGKYSEGYNWYVGP